MFDTYSHESDEFNTIVNVSPPVFDEYFSEDEYIEIEVIEDYTSLKYDENPLDDKQEMDENDSHGTYEGKDSEYFEVEFIDDNKPRVFNRKLVEHDSYILNFIEDYIYDMFAQQIEMEVARVRMREYMICNKLHRINSRMKGRKGKYLCMKANEYKFYHKPYKDHMKIIREEWVEEYDIHDPP